MITVIDFEQDLKKKDFRPTGFKLAMLNDKADEP